MTLNFLHDIKSLIATLTFESNLLKSISSSTVLSLEIQFLFHYFKIYIKLHFIHDECMSLEYPEEGGPSCVYQIAELYTYHQRQEATDG